MNKEDDKLNKFKAEAKLKSKKSDLFNSYLKKLIMLMIKLH